MDDDGPAPGTKRPANPNAIRDHLANERTLLAWIRSSIAIVALGFVVARFGLLLRELGRSAPHQAVGLSTAFGVALVACGAVLVLLATLRYRDTRRAIDENDYRASSALLVLLCAGFLLVSALLVAYLVITG